jgi:hypothetical protein
MKRRSYTKTQIAIWVISLLVVISMLCGLIGSLIGGAGSGTSMLTPTWAQVALLCSTL